MKALLVQDGPTEQGDNRKEKYTTKNKCRHSQDGSEVGRSCTHFLPGQNWKYNQSGEQSP